MHTYIATNFSKLFNFANISTLRAYVSDLAGSVTPWIECKHLTCGVLKGLFLSFESGSSNVV